MNKILEKLSYYDFIYKRRSIRKYDIKPLDKQVLDNIDTHIKNLAYLYPEIEVEIKIVSSADVKGIIQVKAPHYLAIFSEVKEGYHTNVGFILQQMDLYFSANGIGSCWQGWPKPIIELRTNQNLEFVIALAFGTPKNELYRKSASEFKRKTLDKIRIGSGFDELIDAARLAPSPSQPWLFKVEEQVIHLFCSKTKGLWANTFGKIKKIEMGVAICHLWVAAKHFNNKIEFYNDNCTTATIPAGYNYIISAIIR